MRQRARRLIASLSGAAMESRPLVALLGLGVLFLGGLTGGLLGTALLGKTPSERTPEAARPDAASDGSERDLARAIDELAQRVRALGETPAEQPRDDRQPVAEPDATDGSAENRLSAALDRLSTALELAQGRASPGGIGITPLALPPPGSKLGALDTLAGRGWEEISREYRFLTFQQVLDRFGRPDRVENDSWIYLLQNGDGEKSFTFKFSQGYLMNIYD
jgi:hypothetical protein